MTFDRAQLGIPPEEDPWKTKPTSGKESQRQIDAIVERVRKHIAQTFVPTLRTAMEGELRGADSAWELKIDAADPQKVIFIFPGANDAEQGYLRAHVLLELGAQGEPWPSDTFDIRSYAAEAVPNAFKAPTCTVTTLSVSRTFWEKATLLHAEHHRSGDAPHRTSRHYYDLAQLAESKFAETAVAEVGLLDRVVEYKKIFFRSGWANYDSAVPGALRLVPRDEQKATLRKDYSEMNKNGMFFRENPPTFDTIMGRLGALEAKINGN